MTTEITVRGSYSAFQPPERATVRATLGFEGPQMQPVYDRVVHDLEAVKTSIVEIHDPERGPVTWWSTQHVRTWANRPWNQDGKQLPLVHHASVGVQVKFRDFAVLARWVGSHVERTAGFSIAGVDWALTERARHQLARDVRARAVQDAAERAQEYADALELGPVHPVALADAGMLGNGLHPMAGGAETAFMRGEAAKDGAAELALAPDDIEVAAVVDGRFVAG
ncbi:SIMPL domain-containing protein [Nocardioides bizhenqiangii]|uniref:SIMPL domain-containing protein n=1 Tax=Nocardioides bizhenqiangii TaxID=3095076 RepID=A0ABZ0ZNJ4_9ACTN|nr:MULTISPECIES: SIMPL domain-containing protein [unclassified Nocardioides]MDZ5621383.1 SIMPL domain-containing protein [Nocardioides sp. HM23]WQQ25777.1 SIMPL domain-containing protein [Nocardioides sp. HM61]